MNAKRALVTTILASTLVISMTMAAFAAASISTVTENKENLERTNRGLTAYEVGGALQRCAKDQAHWMKVNGDLDHGHHDCGGIIAENIGVSTTPQAIVDAWMLSDGHRANILSTSWTKHGCAREEHATQETVYWYACLYK